MRPVFFLLCFSLFLTACAELETLQSSDDKKELKLKEVSFSELPGWGADDLKTFLAAYEKSCARILKAPADKTFGPLAESGTYASWQKICSDLQNAPELNQITRQAFIESRFTPYAVYADNDREGLFTGYYEASLKGSRTKQGPYKYPLYTRPEDLIMVQLGDFRDELKGQRIAGRVIDGNLKPYEERKEIVEGEWPHNDKVLVWVDDAVDAFFVQIQGSGLIELSDGGQMRIGYAGQNGHPYYAIGRELIKRGYLEKEEISMQSIRDWLELNPAEADEIMNTNKSYVFFRELDNSAQGGPEGGEGVSLTPGRSLAIDRSLISYGIPIWTDIEPPLANLAPLRKLMVAQDTGGAIRGPVRGDVFWGHGDKAEQLAGPMKSKGRYWFLLPKQNLY